MGNQSESSHSAAACSIPAFVITLSGLPLSESGADRCIESAADFGVQVQKFSAVSRYDAIPLMMELGLDINRRIYREISDKPIGDRAAMPRGEWWMTSPEIGCCLSHFRLWEKCIALGKAIMILEHDVVFVGLPPELPPGALVLNLSPKHYPGTQGYVLTPRAARKAVKEIRKRGIQPSDEIIWRTAIRPAKVVDCEPAVVSDENNGLSTIQYTRTDDQHINIHSVDPWLGYSQGKTT